MVDWTSHENVSLLNPRFSSEQISRLRAICARFERNFKGHFFLLTSGTTAASVADLKWVALSKEACLVSAAAVNHHLQSNASDIWLHTLPDFHVGGLGIWARAHLSGAGVIQNSGWNPQQFHQSLLSTRATLTALVPAQIYDLVQNQLTCPKSLRAVLVGGGALAPALYRKGRQLGWPLLPTYGMTETASQVATASLDSLSENESAPPDLEILQHFQVSQTSEGLFQMRGKSLLSAYFFESQGQSVQQDTKVNGWFTSQDRGEIFGNHLRIFGRAGDFIKIGGESVELGRLRDILEATKLEIPGLNDVALVSFPDERLGHVIHLAVDSQSTPRAVRELTQAFNSRVLGFEKIREAHVLEALPRTSLGKLNPSECLRLCQQAARSSL